MLFFLKRGRLGTLKKNSGNFDFSVYWSDENFSLANSKNLMELNNNFIKITYQLTLYCLGCRPFLHNTRHRLYTQIV